VSKALLAAGVLVVPAGPKVVRFIPPLIVTEAEVTEAMSRFETALVKIQSDNKAKAATSAAEAAPAGDFLNKIGEFFGKLFSSTA
jgi:hypothetical protein